MSLNSFNPRRPQPLSPQRLIDAPIDQQNVELIYGMVQCPKWYPINYTVGGFYDRCLENFKEHASEDLLSDNDEYGWVRLSTTSNVHTIWLAKPNKEVKRKSKTLSNPPNPNHPFKYGNNVISYWTNVIRLDIFLYYSVEKENIQGFTFGDRKNILKPLKILNHQWVPVYNPIYAYSTYKCNKCGLSGAPHKSNSKAIVPESLLTCEEVMIRNIIM